jgi:hypothetical protein
MVQTTRRQFLDTLLIGATGVSVLAACGDDSSSGGDSGPRSCAPSDTIASNHGHSVVIPSAHVMEGTERSYSIQGTSPHDHMITVTAAMFAQLAAGMTVNTGSTTGGADGHNHMVTIRCA